MVAWIFHHEAEWTSVAMTATTIVPQNRTNITLQQASEQGRGGKLRKQIFYYNLLIYEVHSIIIILVNVSLFPLIEESFLFSSRGP